MYRDHEFLLYTYLLVNELKYGQLITILYKNTRQLQLSLEECVVISLMNTVPNCFVLKVSYP